MIELLVISPGDHIVTNAPEGFALADQVFQEASLVDALSENQRAHPSLERTLGLLIRRYPRRIRVRWANPWSPGGLLACIRYRVRTFPAVIMNRARVLDGEQLDPENLRNIIEAELSKPAI